ncbi:SET domain-containing protein [Serendipita vermifera]|nr:SET domain-containing protein [Serendipita vermifera]
MNVDIELEEAIDSGYQTEQTIIPESAEPETITDIVDGVYERCWKEFYEWEPEYCKERLKDLRDSQPLPDWFEDWGESEDWDLNDITPSQPIYETNEPVMMEVSSAFIGIQHHGSSELTTTAAHKIKISTTFPSVPAYEFCMYSNQIVPSYAVQEDEVEPEAEDGRDPGNTQDNQDQNSQATGNQNSKIQKWRLWIPFCPYTDQDSELEESSRRGIIEGQVCEWEEPKVWNNDVLVIIMESVRRLRKQGISLADIDLSSVFPHTVLPFGDELGISKLWGTCEPLVVPMWEEYRVSDDLAIKSDVNAQTTVKTTWREILHLWCPICLEVECTTHVRGNFEVINNEERMAKLPVRVPNPTQPCHDSDCILARPEMNHYEWPLQKTAWLRLILETEGLIKWTTSCDIAKLIGESCWQTYREMTSILESPEDDINPNLNTTRAFTPLELPDLKQWVPYSPCAHKGLCLTCSCASAGQYCRRSCQCSPKCTRRRPGCRCKGPCSSRDCSCRRENKECEPGECTRCSPGNLRSICTNNSIQRGRKRRTLIHRAHHGWGLFAAENLRKGDYIMTYIGEMYHIHTTTTPRVLMAKHIGRNYNFELSDLVELDASSVGNESRFINDHKDKTNHNCFAKHIWVSGELYLTIHAAREIKEGEELFMPYGKKYWQNNDQFK